MKRGAAILLINPTMRAALLVRRSSDMAYPGLWHPPGGIRDPEDATPWMTAQREFTEETGLRAPSKWAHAHRQGEPGKSEFITFVAYDPFPTLRIPRLNWENDAYRWTTLHEAISGMPLFPRFSEILAQVPY